MTKSMRNELAHMTTGNKNLCTSLPKHYAALDDVFALGCEKHWMRHRRFYAWHSNIYIWFVFCSYLKYILAVVNMRLYLKLYHCCWTITYRVHEIEKNSFSNVRRAPWEKKNNNNLFARTTINKFRFTFTHTNRQIRKIIRWIVRWTKWSIKSVASRL